MDPARLEALEGRVDRLESAQADMGARLIVLEVSGAERHTATLAALRASDALAAERLGGAMALLGHRLDRLERAVWGAVGVVLTGIVLAVLRLVLASSGG